MVHFLYPNMYRTRAFFSPQIVTQSIYKGQREIRSSTDCHLYIATVGVSLKSVAAVGRCTTGLKIITYLSSIALYCIVYFTIIDCIVLYCTVLYCIVVLLCLEGNTYITYCTCNCSCNMSGYCTRQCTYK